MVQTYHSETAVLAGGSRQAGVFVCFGFVWLFHFIKVDEHYKSKSFGEEAHLFCGFYQSRFFTAEQFNRSTLLEMV